MGIPMLLSIVEMGGYPDFTSLYRRAGYRPEKVHSMRNAQAWLKKQAGGGGGGVSFRSGAARPDE